MFRFFKRDPEGEVRSAHPDYEASTARPDSKGVMRFVAGPFKGMALKDIGRPSMDRPDLKLSNDLREVSLRSASEFQTEHGPGYERLLLSKLRSWVEGQPSPDDVFFDSHVIVSTLVTLIPDLLPQPLIPDLPPQPLCQPTSSPDWYEQIADGIARIADDPDLLTEIDRAIGDLIIDTRAPERSRKGFLASMAANPASGILDRPSAEIVNHLWKLLMTCLTVGVEDYNRFFDQGPPFTGDLSAAFDAGMEASDKALVALLAADNQPAPDS